MRTPHPSGRPIRNRVIKSAASFTRVPHSQPLTPGLRREGHCTNAIGFTADLSTDDQGDD